MKYARQTLTRTAGPKACLVPEADHVVARWNHRDVYFVHDGSVLAHVVFAEGVWEVLVARAARVAAAARAALARMTVHVVAVGTDKIGHRDRRHHPADAAAFAHDSVADALRAVRKEHCVIVRREVQLVLGLLEACLRQLLGLGAEAVFVPSPVAAQHQGREG